MSSERRKRRKGKERKKERKKRLGVERKGGEGTGPFLFARSHPRWGQRRIDCRVICNNKGGSPYVWTSGPLLQYRLLSFLFFLSFLSFFPLFHPSSSSSSLPEKDEYEYGFDIVSRVYAMKLNNRIRSIFIEDGHNGNGVRARPGDWCTNLFHGVVLIFSRTTLFENGFDASQQCPPDCPK